MKAPIIVFLFVILHSCTPKNSDFGKLECKNYVGISDSLYNALLFYQSKNPIPASKKYSLNTPLPPEAAFRYIYEVQITKEKDDTLIIISLKPDGINLNQNKISNIVFGVYQDSCLKPTYFTCDSNLTRGFINVYEKKNLDKFKYDNSSKIDFTYVQYLYKVVNTNIVFKTKVKGNKGE